MFRIIPIGPIRYGRGDTIMSQGQEGESFFLILGPKRAEVEVVRLVKGCVT